MTTNRPRRRWFQFRLGAVLLSVLAVAILLALEVNRARAQARAVAAVKAYGGFVRYAHEYVNGTYTPGREPWAPGWLRGAIGDDFFRTAIEVNLVFDGGSQKQVSTEREDDAVMPVLRDLPSLKTLMIHKDQAADRAIKVVRHLRSLENLYVPEARNLTDAGLAHIAGLRNLKDLSLTEVRVTDAGLAHLSGLRALKNLYVWPVIDVDEVEDDRPGITDAGLRSLSELHNLEDLTVFNGSFTDNGLADLARLVNLKALRLTFGTYRFSPSGLAMLSRLRNLSQLDLQGQGLSGAGLDHLAGLPNLTQVLLGLESPLLENGSDLREGAQRLALLRPDLSVE